MHTPFNDNLMISELTLLTIILDYSGVVKAHNCSVTIIKNKIFADCSYRDMGVCVPQDLHPDVTVGAYCSRLDFKKMCFANGLRAAVLTLYRGQTAQKAQQKWFLKILNI